MANLISVNVGLPAEVTWRGKLIRTAIWKRPVEGRVFAGRLNLVGDKQADLVGHGGEQRAVMVYQLDSYRYWSDFLGRSDFEPGRGGVVRARALFGARLPGLLDELTETLVA